MNNMKKKLSLMQKEIVHNGGIRILFSAVFVLALLLVNWRHTGVTFETNDDYGIMSIVAGFHTGTPTAIPFLSNYLYLKLLASLYTLNGSVPWYLYMFLLIIFMSAAIICSCCIKACRKLKFPLFFGLFLFGILFVGIYRYTFVMVQFTTVAAISGAAACALLMEKSEEDCQKEVVFSVICEVLFLFIALLIRNAIGCLAILIFICVAVLKRWLQEYGWRTACLYIVVPLMLLAGTNAVQKFHINGDGWKASLTHYEKWVKWMDYPHLPYEGNEEIYQSVEWDETLYVLAEGWFSLDERQTADAFEVLNGAYENRQVKISLKQNIKRMMRKDILVVLLAEGVSLFLYAVGCLGERQLKQALGCFAWMMVTGVLLFYFACTGREMTHRIVNSIFILSVTPAFLYISHVINPISPTRFAKLNNKIICGIGCMIACTLLIWKGWYMGNRLRCDEDYAQRKRMEAYAIEHDNKFIIHDLSLLDAGSPFQVYAGKKPCNLSFWGGWAVGTPIWYEQIKRYGFDELSSEDFGNDNIWFMGSADGANLLFSYMKGQYPGCQLQIIDETEEFIVYRFDQVDK